MNNDANLSLFFTLFMVLLYLIDLFLSLTAHGNYGLLLYGKDICKYLCKDLEN